MNSFNTQRNIALIGALLGWFALIAQLVLSIENRVTSLAEAIIRYFSYFTILINILVVICFTLLWSNKGDKQNKFWTQPSTIAAIVVYIAVVGIIYNVALRSLWNPAGIQKITDELLHVVIPLIFLLYWVFFVPKQRLNWKYVLKWLWVPFFYLMYTLVRGAVTNFYPYPFLDAYNHGYQKVMVSAFFIMFVFLLFSAFVVVLSRFLSSKQGL